MRLLPVEYLPDDYKGPNASTEKELIGTDNYTFFGRYLRTCFARVTVVHSVTATLSFLRIQRSTTHILYFSNCLPQDASVYVNQWVITLVSGLRH